MGLIKVLWLMVGLALSLPMLASSVLAKPVLASPAITNSAITNPVIKKQALSIAALAEMRTVKKPSLSPDGQRIAVMHYHAPTHNYDVQISAIEQSIKPITIKLGEYTPIRLRWANNQYLLVTAKPQLSNARPALAAMSDKVFLVVNTADHSVERLKLPIPGEIIKADYFNYDADAHVWFLLVTSRVIDTSGKNNAVLMFDAGKFRVVKVSLKNPSKIDIIEKTHTGVAQWVYDGQGQPFVGTQYSTTHAISFYYDKKRRWKKLKRSRFVKDPLFFPVASGQDRLQPSVYVISNHETGFDGLYRYLLDTNEYQRVFLDEQYDVQSVILSPDRSRVLGVSVVDDYPKQVFIDSHYQAVINDINQQLPNRNNTIVSDDLQGNVFVVASESYDTAGEYYIYQQAKNELQYFSDFYTALSQYDLHKTKRLEYESQDGYPITAYLTYPANTISNDAPAQKVQRPTEAEKKLPLIVMPHGGPYLRTTKEYSYLREYFASRGYLVFEPNFRGSTGYGLAHIRAADNEWGGKVIADIEQGIAELIKSGLVLEDNICAVGGSFGGYAALMLAVRQAYPYRCVISYAGVSNLKKYIANKEPNTIWNEFISKNFSKAKSQSPVNYVGKINTPVLLVHGAKDRVVNVEHSRDMAQRLTRIAKPVVYEEIAEANHYFSRAQQRQRLLQVTENFLSQYMPVTY